MTSAVVERLAFIFCWDCTRQLLPASSRSLGTLSGCLVGALTLHCANKGRKATRIFLTLLHLYLKLYIEKYGLNYEFWHHYQLSIHFQHSKLDHFDDKTSFISTTVHTSIEEFVSEPVARNTTKQFKIDKYFLLYWKTRIRRTNHFRPAEILFRFELHFCSNLQTSMTVIAMVM